MQIFWIEQLPDTQVNKGSIVIFGGTFDPLHQGHLGAIASLQEKFSTVILAPTTANPWKENEATSLDIRLEMFRALYPNIHELSKPQKNELLSLPLALWEKGYHYAFQVVEIIQRLAPESDLMWAIGEDLVDEINDWKNWSTKGIPAVVVPIKPNIHATDVRAGTVSLLPELQAIVDKHKLYR